MSRSVHPLRHVFNINDAGEKRVKTKAALFWGKFTALNIQPCFI